MLRYLLVVVALLASSNAFVTTQSHIGKASVPTRPVSSIMLPKKMAFLADTSLAAKKGPATKKSVESVKPSVDWGNILYLLLWPGNPYSWFFYAFSFIIIYGNLAPK
jgi:hypothetical protein